MILNHSILLDIIFSNGGHIGGGYAREWVLNGSPCDTGWNDLDIICKKDKEDVIKNKILQIYPNLKLDFRMNIESLGWGSKSFYSVNVIYFKDKETLCLWKEDKVRSIYKEYTDVIIESINNKKCICRSNLNGNRDLLMERKIKNKGFTIEYPFINDLLEL
jgi:hypothetical protein